MRLQTIHDAIPRYAIIRLYDMRIEEAGDRVICESYKYLYLIPEDSSSSDFFFLEL